MSRYLGHLKIVLMMSVCKCSQLGRARIKKFWLSLRRAIALAELMGLARASMASRSQQEPPPDTSWGSQQGLPTSIIDQRRQKAALWEAVCYFDRIASIMWSLPLATASYPLLKRMVVDADGQVIPQQYLYKLADIVSRVLDLESGYSSGKPFTASFDAVIRTDQELRLMASLPPKDWWKVEQNSFSIEAPLQWWHRYLTVRTHLHLALRHNEGQQFAFNFITCLAACQELARRYVSLRPTLPSGFFVNRVIDLQAFTAIVFLLLASYRTACGTSNVVQGVDVEYTKDLVNQVVRVMEQVAGRTSGEFAHKAVGAIRSLTSMLQRSQTSESQRITLDLPLVGRIHVSRKSCVAKAVSSPSFPTLNQPLQETLSIPSGDGSTLIDQAMPSAFSDLELMDSLSYSLEIPENFSFLIDETLDAEDWLTQTGWQGNV